jgi:hypothetical protein
LIVSGFDYQHFEDIYGEEYADLFIVSVVLVLAEEGGASDGIVSYEDVYDIFDLITDF